MAFFIIIFGGCIKEFEPDLPEGPVRLVVEGRITNEPGPYTIKLNITAAFNFEDEVSGAEPVTGARVTIADDTGVEETLAETSSGTYVTSETGIRGTIGRTYQLTIVTADGREFQSQPERMLPVPDIDSVFYTFETSDEPIDTPLQPNDAINIDFDSEELQDPINNIPDLSVAYAVPPEYEGVSGTILGNSNDLRPKDNFEPTSSGLRINSVTQDPAGAQNFYKWRVTGTFEIRTNPEGYILAASARGISSPFFYFQVPKDCCSQCWVHFDLPSLFIGEDRLLDGNLFEQELTLFPIHQFLFHKQFYVEIEQASLSLDAFNFYNSIFTQIEQVGSIFDAAPQQVLSNVVNLQNPNEPVLGYFVVSAVSRKGLFIEPEDLPEPLDLFLHADDCREVSNEVMTSVTERPEFWPQ